MSVTINFSKNTSAPWQSNANMLKSTREKIQRQEERDGKIAFFETQKQNLKNQKADTIEEIAKKLEKFHTYEDEIAAAKQEYNSSQMFHILDEAERAESRWRKRLRNISQRPRKSRKRRLKARQQEQTAKPMIRVFYGISEISAFIMPARQTTDISVVFSAIPRRTISAEQNRSTTAHRCSTS